jgi:predicted esterase
MDSFESWRDAKLLPMLSSRLNSDCLLLSYAGYPHCAPTNKTGAARDDEVVRRAVSAVQEAQRHYNNVWLTGHSLGCAVALQCCRHVRPSGLLLVSPFASLRSVAENEYGSMGSWAAGARFDSTQVAKECVRCPVMILHGVNDAVVPPAQSQALFDALPANALKHRFMVPAMQHALAPAHIAVLALRVSQHYPPSRTNAGCTALQFT